MAMNLNRYVEHLFRQHRKGEAAAEKWILMDLMNIRTTEKTAKW